VSQLLQHWVTEQAERRAASTALVMRDEGLTYGQLEAQTNQLARMLKDQGCKRGDRVCLLMPKSPSAIVAILGVLKADCVYVPVDLGSPVSRLAEVVASAEPRCILAMGPGAGVLDGLWAGAGPPRSIAVGWMDSEPVGGRHFTPDFVRADCTGYGVAPVAYLNGPQDIAYILFTSGSTGIPKGVPITHANVAHFVRWATRYFDMTPSDRMSGHPPLHFDLSVFDIFGTFAAGAELHLVPPDLNLLPNRLAHFIAASALTQWFSVPSLLTYMAKFDAVPLTGFPTLKRLLWCGEVLPTPVLMYWMKRLPSVSFTNLYGPTEATIASSHYTVPRCPDDPTEPVPIGTACDGEELLVLNERLQPVTPGETGDLWIRGAGLSPGYWRDPEKTRAAFLPVPTSGDPSDRIYRTGDLATVAADGLINLLGRADSQVKSRGYRIELGEIETYLHTLTSLTESAVVAIRTDGFEGATICCAYVPAPHADVAPATLRRELAQNLPSYMLPSRWLAVDVLPKNANGKIDRRQLEKDFHDRAGTPEMAPPARLPEQLTKLFRQKLQLDIPSADTDLVDAGLLDSLQFVQLLLLLEREFGLQIPLEGFEIDHFRSVESIADIVVAGSRRHAHHEDR
jgi:amino acid adenylation domain-containing protein